MRLCLSFIFWPTVCLSLALTPDFNWKNPTEPVDRGKWSTTVGAPPSNCRVSITVSSISLIPPVLTRYRCWGSFPSDIRIDRLINGFISSCWASTYDSEMVMLRRSMQLCLLFIFFTVGEVGGGDVCGGGGDVNRVVNLSAATYFRCASSGPLSVGVLTHHRGGWGGVGGARVSLRAWRGNKETKRSLNHSRSEGSRRWTHLNTKVRV